MKPNESMEVVLFNRAVAQTLNVVEVSLVHEVNLSNCGSHCILDFDIWGSQQKEDWLTRIESHCKWEVLDGDSLELVSLMKVFTNKSSILIPGGFLEQTDLDGKEGVNPHILSEFQFKMSSKELGSFTI